jgi:hypothetical protein
MFATIGIARTKGGLSGLQASCFHLILLQFGACGEMFEIDTLQPGIPRGSSTKGPPEGQFPSNAKLQEFQGFKGA